MILARSVAWEAKELERDALSTPTKNSLGSTLTVFALPKSAEAELVAQLEGKVDPKTLRTNYWKTLTKRVWSTHYRIRSQSP